MGVDYLKTKIEKRNEEERLRLERQQKLQRLKRFMEIDKGIKKMMEMGKEKRNGTNNIKDKDLSTREDGTKRERKAKGNPPQSKNLDETLTEKKKENTCYRYTINGDHANRRPTEG